MRHSTLRLRAKGLRALLLAGSALGALATGAQAQLPTELIARAVLPAETFAAGPPSGRQLVGKQVNGFEVPFSSQPVQGFSALLDNRDGTFLALCDNGYGAKDNSIDFYLRAYRIRPHWKTTTGGEGTIEVLDFIEFRDPDKKVPFSLVEGNTPERRLTGADFDPESIQRAPDGTYWVGDEFGPFLLHFDATGKLLDAPYGLPDFDHPGDELRSPQHPAYANQPTPAQQSAPRVQPSGGFEGMAISTDGKTLLPVLEKPLVEAKGQRTLLIHEFDLATRRYTGKRYTYLLEPKGASLPDFIMISKNKGLVLERDGSAGDLKGFKAVFEITLPEEAGPVAKRRVADLLAIPDPARISGPPVAGDVGLGETFAMPFVTIESLVLIDRQTVGIVNDNNFPFSIGRHFESKRVDDNEFILLRVPGLQDK